MGVSEGAAVASGCDEGNAQAVMDKERMKRKAISITSLLDGFIRMSFFEESIRQLYKQAAHVGGLLV